MQYFLDKREDEKTVIIQLPGKINSSNAGDLKYELIKFIQEGYLNVVIDLEKTVAVDLSGMSAFTLGNRIYKGAAGSFLLTNVPQQTQCLIRACSLVPILNITTNLQQALDWVRYNNLQKEMQKFN